jgi:hypothetical protein
MGYESEDLIDDFDGITEKDIIQYKYPDDKELERVGVRGIYLNNYIRWDSKAQHEEMIKNFAYKTATQTRTFDTYNDVDCFNYSDVHDYIKFLKHGYSKVTDHATREIRLRRMTREEGFEMVRKYLGIKPNNLLLFLDWIGMTENSFNYIIDQHRSKDAWKRNENWDWELKKDFLKVLQEAGEKTAALKPVEQFSPFQLTGKGSSSDREDKYILIGKGYYEN